MSILHKELYIHLLLHEEELHTHEYYVHTISIQAVFLYSIHGGYSNKRLVSLVTHLLIPILMVSDVQTHNVALKLKNARLVLFVAPYYGYP